MRYGTVETYGDTIDARYVAIIADGNGRWAHAQGLPVQEGHQAGADTLKARLRDAVELGVQELTVYSFSTENWSRPADEVHALIAMIADRITQEAPALDSQGVQMRFVGRRTGVPNHLVKQMAQPKSSPRPTNASFCSSRSTTADAPRSLTPQDDSVEAEKTSSAPAYTHRRCTIRTSSSAPETSSDSPTICSGKPPTQSWYSARSLGQTSRDNPSSNASQSSDSADARSGYDDQTKLRDPNPWRYRSTTEP